MFTLAINTSGPMESLAVFSKNKLLAQTSWKGNYDETKKLLPAVEKLLKKVRVGFSDIDRIVVVSGPGSFTALRIGVTVANVLAFGLEVPLFSVSTMTLAKFSDKSFGEIMLSLRPSHLKKEFPVVPKYSKPPNITKPRPHVLKS